MLLHHPAWSCRGAILESKGNGNESSPVTVSMAEGGESDGVGGCFISNLADLMTNQVLWIAKEMILRHALLGSMDCVAREAEQVCIWVEQIFSTTLHSALLALLVKGSFNSVSGLPTLFCSVVINFVFQEGRSIPKLTFFFFFLQRWKKQVEQGFSTHYKARHSPSWMCATFQGDTRPAAHWGSAPLVKRSLIPMRAWESLCIMRQQTLVIIFGIPQKSGSKEIFFFKCGLSCN